MVDQRPRSDADPRCRGHIAGGSIPGPDCPPRSCQRRAGHDGQCFDGCSSFTPGTWDAPARKIVPDAIDEWARATGERLERMNATDSTRTTKQDDAAQTEPNPVAAAGTAGPVELLDLIRAQLVEEFGGEAFWPARIVTVWSHAYVLAHDYASPPQPSGVERDLLREVRDAFDKFTYENKGRRWTGLHGDTEIEGLADLLSRIDAALSAAGKPGEPL